MKRTQSEYVTAPPARRPLKIFSTDPMLGRTAGNRISIDVVNERLNLGPAGRRIVVIDYDGGHNRFYPPGNLNDPAILIQGGLDPQSPIRGSTSRWFMPLQCERLRTRPSAASQKAPRISLAS